MSGLECCTFGAQPYDAQFLPIAMRHTYCEAETILPSFLRNIVPLNAKTLSPQTMSLQASTICHEAFEETVRGRLWSTGS